MDTTSTLVAHTEGDDEATNELISRLYNELRRCAAIYMGRERPGNTLQPTALVHEAFLRLIDGNRVNYQNEAHFKALAATQMKRILIDSARAKSRLKRKGIKVELIESQIGCDDSALDVLVLNEVLEDLARHNERQANVFELHFYGGLTFAEIASVAGLSTRTMKEDWATAKAWIFTRLNNYHAQREET